MNLMTIRYVVLIVAAIIFIWAAIEMSWRLKRRKKENTSSFANWIKLDAQSPKIHQAEPLLDEGEEEEEKKTEQKLHLRAQQNGHYSAESKKRL